MLFFVPCFMGGVLAYYLGSRKRGVQKSCVLPAALWPVALLALIAVYLWVRRNVATRYMTDYVLCMVVGALIPAFRDLTPSWLTGACHIIARYSYGIYLFHLPVIWFAFVKLRAFPPWFQWVSFWVLMGLIPWMAYTWLETPSIEAGRHLANRLTHREAESRVASPASP